MQGVRIQARQLGFKATGFLPVLPGEPVFDPATKRLGVGIGSNQAVWFPKATSQGDLEFDDDQGLISSSGDYHLKFTPKGVSWAINGIETLLVGDDGIMIRGELLMRNAAGSDTVVVGYAHWVAIMSMLWNIKTVLRKIVAGTAVTADINNLFNAPNLLNLTSLDPAFPEAPAL